MTFKTIIGLVLLFFIGRFLLRVIIPIVRVTKATQKSMNNLRDQMQNMQNNQGYAQNNNTAEQSSKKPRPEIEGEYIEFEEIK